MNMGEIMMAARARKGIPANTPPAVRGTAGPAARTPAAHRNTTNNPTASHMSEAPKAPTRNATTMSGTLRVIRGNREYRIAQ